MIQGCGEKGSISDNAFSRWALLESLQLDGSDFAEDLTVTHVQLRSLQIIDWVEHCSLVLACPSLEQMKICSDTFDAKCVENINATCPSLKKVEIGRAMNDGGYEDWDEGDKNEGLLEFVHEGVAELVLRNLTRAKIRVDCAKLQKLVLMLLAEEQLARTTILEINCPEVRSLVLDGYGQVFLCVPQILTMLPTQESLRIGCVSEKAKHVVWKHNKIRDLVIAKSDKKIDSKVLEDKLKTLTLEMPSLVRVSVELSSVQVMASSKI